MSRPCFRDHHRATAESTPPDSRTIARSIESRLISGPALRIALRSADGTLPPHKYLSQTRVIQGTEKGFRRRAAGAGGTAPRAPRVHPRFLRGPRLATSQGGPRSEERRVGKECGARWAA